MVWALVELLHFLQLLVQVLEYMVSNSRGNGTLFLFLKSCNRHHNGCRLFHHVVLVHALGNLCDGSEDNNYKNYNGLHASLHLLHYYNHFQLLFHSLLLPLLGWSGV